MSDQSILILRVRTYTGIRKCSKFVSGKKSAAGDKPAVKRNENPISWQRLPFSKAPLLTSEDLATQKTRVSQFVFVQSSSLVDNQFSFWTSGTKMALQLNPKKMTLRESNSAVDVL